MSISAVSVSKAARRSENAVVSGIGASGERVDSADATIGNSNCATVATVAISIGHVLGGFEDGIKAI
jgi:hypothetical protein